MKKYIPVLVSFFMAIGLVSTKPLVVYADSLTSSNIVGVNYNILDYNVSVNPQTATISGTTYSAIDYVLEFDVILDDYYIGEITGDLFFVYSGYVLGNNTATLTNYNYSKNNITYYVNGNHFTIPLSLRVVSVVNTNSYSFINQSTLSFTLDSSDVVGIPESSRGFEIPFESLGFYYQFFYEGTFQAIDYTTDFYNSKLPIYYIPSNSQIYRGLMNNTNSANYNRSLTFVMATTLDITNTTTCATKFTIDTNEYRVYDFQVLYLSELNYNSTNQRIRIIKFSVMPKTAVSRNLVLKVADNSYLTPIYAGYTYLSNVSNDFALTFGLSNSMLDNIDKIANGNSQSNTSSSSLESSTSDFNEEASDMFDLENDFNQNLNDSLDDIDPDFSFDNSFGSKFLYSAEFVKDEFDFLTENNAFGSLLAFSLLLGLGLLILGKVL